MPPQEPSNKGNSKNIIIIVVILGLLLVGVFLWQSGNKGIQPTPSADIVQKVKQISTEPVEKVVVETVDVSAAKTEADKIADGFPPNIPIETQGIISSDSKSYTDRPIPITLYNVTYSTTKSASDKYIEYLNYMTKNGYDFGTTGKNEKSNSLYGTKEGKTLLIIASTVGGKTTVQIAYSETK